MAQRAAVAHVAQRDGFEYGSCHLDPSVPRIGEALVAAHRDFVHEADVHAVVHDGGRSMPRAFSTASPCGPASSFSIALCAVLLLCLHADRRRISGVVLDFGRKRADEFHALHREDFADLVQAEFRLAARDQLGDVAALFQFRLRLDVRRDAELVEQAGQVDSARSARGRIDVGDRLRRRSARS